MSTTQVACLRCGKCCSTLKAEMLPITIADYRRIRIRLGKPHPSLKEKGIVLQDGRCPFLTAFNTCRIYEFRPMVCRTYKCWTMKQTPKSNPRLKKQGDETNG